MSSKTIHTFIIVCALFIQALNAQFLSFEKVKNGFTVSEPNRKISLLLDQQDDPGILKIAKYFKADLESVTGNQVEIIYGIKSEIETLIIVGTLEKSALIRDLVADGELGAKELSDQWEKFVVKEVKYANGNPSSNAMVIAGSDKRGAIYGMFEISRQIGVSPWYYWADVPIDQHPNVYLKPGIHTLGEPDVKYRGIFLNDEAPALTGWVEGTFGGFHHEFYEKVFELILRNKGNYLWPAMWRPRAFADDDPENARLADEMGIVISTSHHEPMMRAHDEWSRYGEGEWNYEKNREHLREFWKEGIERMGNFESVVTVGMRGDGDEAMSEETAVDLMKEIIGDQREIIEDVTKQPAEETPQVWAIYKEVQDYYDKGLRVDDDIIVLLCDDNWGNIRILPKPEDLDRSGGYGIYYHFDFVGGPVSYRWVNVTQIERVWEQMNLAYDWGVKDLWIVNVGDLKPMELPISFFLDFAWDASINAAELPKYYVNWATEQFGDELVSEIGEILSLSTKYSARRTPEMLKPDTYSLINYREAETVLKDYNALLNRSKIVYDYIDNEFKSAYYQLVHFPIEILANLNEMYVAAGKNRLYTIQERASANYYADHVKQKFFQDEELTAYYHEEMSDGKWNHMMSQTHIGYTSWSAPRVNKMPEVSYIQLPEEPKLGYVIEHGKENKWSRGGFLSRSFPVFDPYNDQEYFLEIFNQGNGLLPFNLKTDGDWIKLSTDEGSIKYEQKVYVSIDWEKAPKGEVTGHIEISSLNNTMKVAVPIINTKMDIAGFLENNGVVSIDASDYHKMQNSRSIKWVTVPNMGRTASSMTIDPANAPQQVPDKKTPCLSYNFTLFDSAELKIETYLSPTLNYKKEDGLKYAIAVDDEMPQVINLHAGEEASDWEYPDWWNKSVTDHIKKKISEHDFVGPGEHTLTVWMIDPGVVFQKFVLNAGGLKQSYLGPPESVFID